MCYESRLVSGEGVMSLGESKEGAWIWYLEMSCSGIGKWLCAMDCGASLL